MIDSTCRVHIDWNNFRHNLRILMQKGRTLMPVIKADAYGHGVLRASEELTSLGIDWAAIGTLDEGCRVRDHGYKGNIVSLLCPTLSPEDIRLAREKNILPTVHHWAGLKAVDETLRSDASQTAPLRIAIKIDSGMSRLGFTLEELEEVASFITENGRIEPVLLLSHLAVADDPEENDFTERQAGQFFKGADIMHRYFPNMLCSLGNTAGLMSHTSIAGDICRPGLAVYGYNPLFGTSRENDCE